MPVVALALFGACRSVPSPQATREESVPPAPGRERGVARIYDAHCGGAMLTDEESAQLEHPAANVTFVVLSGSRNTAAPPAARFVTAADGSFDVPKLAPGSYCVVRTQISADEEARILALPE